MTRLDSKTIARVLMLVALLAAIASSAIARADLISRIASETDGPRTVITPALRAKVSARHFVFIGGFMNELPLVRYFKANRDEIEDSFDASTEFYRIDSERGIDLNADALRGHLLKSFRDAGGKPLVLVAHSYGGAVAAYLALRDRDLLHDGIIDRIVTVQGALGGSRLADAVAPGCKLRSRVEDGSLPSIQCFFSPEGLRQLKPSSMKAAFEPLTSALKPSDLRVLAKKIFYVRTRQVGDEGGGTDLIVDTEFQKLDSVGTDMGVIPGTNHFGLVFGLPLTGSGRRRVTRAIVLELFAPIAQRGLVSTHP